VKSMSFLQFQVREKLAGLAMNANALKANVSLPVFHLWTPRRTGSIVWAINDQRNVPCP
jgi:hypothetical protein